MPLSPQVKKICQSPVDSAALYRLWLLRLLMPLGAQRKFVKSHGFDSDALAEVLGLGRWIESDSDSESGAAEPEDELGWADDAEDTT